MVDLLKYRLIFSRYFKKPLDHPLKRPFVLLGKRVIFAKKAKCPSFCMDYYRNDFSFFGYSADFLEEQNLTQISEITIYFYINLNIYNNRIFFPIILRKSEQNNRSYCK